MQVSAINDQAVISRKPSLIAADVANEAILLDVDSGYFFQLNISAARIWGLVETPRSFGDLCGELSRAYAVDPEECRADVQEFVADMRERGLVEISA
jgi:hypothetical protein